MIGFRFSMRWVFAAVAYFALLAAALTDGSIHWFASLALITVFAMLVSLLGIVYRRDEQRSFWVGFAVFGWAYLIMCHVPPLANALPTSDFFWELYPLFRRTAPIDPLKPTPAWVRTTDSENGRTVAVIVMQQDFRRLGHSVCTLLVAFLGGALGRWFYLSMTRQTSLPTTAPPDV